MGLAETVPMGIVLTALNSKRNLSVKRSAPSPKFGTNAN